MTYDAANGSRIANVAPQSGHADAGIQAHNVLLRCIQAIHTKLTYSRLPNASNDM